MPLEAKPLFRPDVLRTRLDEFLMPPQTDSLRQTLTRWADLISSNRIDRLGEQQILPDFLTDFFIGLLGYTGPAGAERHEPTAGVPLASNRVPLASEVGQCHAAERYTLSREQHIAVDGKYADAVLGDFNGASRFVVALEGKGPRDPLDRPFAGRRMSAVDQGYRYAINLPCDWIIVTSIRQTRLYHKRRPAGPRYAGECRVFRSPHCGIASQQTAPDVTLNGGTEDVPALSGASLWKSGCRNTMGGIRGETDVFNSKGV